SLYRINDLSTSFIYRKKRILSELNADIDIENISYLDRIFLTDKHIKLITSLSFDEENYTMELKPSQLIFEDAKFDAEGIIDLSEKGLFDLKIDGSNHHFSFFSIILSEQGIANLEVGDFYFSGTIKGNAFSEIPIIDFSFGVKDVELFIPEINKRIRDFGFSGYFNSGTKKNLSEANLKIENLQAILPDGFLNGSFKVKNFDEPYLDLKLKMKASVDGFDDILKIDFINNLTGTIEITDTVKGYYKRKENRIEAEDNRATIIFNNLSFNLPGIMEVQNFDGVIKRNLDRFELKNLKIITNNTDLLINGELNNPHYLLFNIEKEISANVTVKSSMFDLPKFLGYDPSINESFPYKIKNIDLTLDASTTTNKILNFKSFPEIDFHISKLEATIEEFLPPLEIKSGAIKKENDQFYIDNLSLISEDTDLLINGKINNLLHLFLNDEKVITADLKIKANVFDLPNFLAFDPSIGRSFPYQIKNLNLDVSAESTTSKLLNFDSFPEIVFNIKHLDATAENFLPPLIINSGIFQVSENILGFHMDFDYFKTNFLGGELNFTADYNSSKHQPYYIKGNFDLAKLNPGKLIYDDPADTIPEFLDGKLSGSFFSEFQFPLDSTIVKFINLKDGNLFYESSKDTFTINSLNFYLTDLYFNEKLNPNPFATLSTNGYIKVSALHSNQFFMDDFRINYNVNSGTYQFEPNRPRLFGESAKGKSTLTISPFGDNPSYSISYDVEQFFAEEMLATFMEDTLITGPLKLSMNLSSRGKDWEAIVKNINGEVNLSGNNLMLYGIDADQIIEKIKRSQNYTLADLGAVLLAGPVGIAITKGSDLASIFILNTGQTSIITNLVNNWKIEHGKFIIDDVAFSTEKNRIATIGSINFPEDSLNITIALLNKHGCSIFSQRVYGDLNSPTLGRVKVLGTILAPLANLMDDLLGADCEVFYNSSLPHPK
ncbi:MAG: AsmA-like C-terminal region-containing protein, partial [Ignavibacteriaceae bacterium]